eukprot:195076-Chlamydomonas_euryale.AAC.1
MKDKVFMICNFEPSRVTAATPEFTAKQIKPELGKPEGGSGSTKCATPTPSRPHLVVHASEQVKCGALRVVRSHHTAVAGTEVHVRFRTAI